MKNEHAAVIKRQGCSVCGAMNRVGYGFNELTVEGACGFYGSIVRWKRDGPEDETAELINRPVETVHRTADLLFW